jgi:hypothetical protein
LRLRRRHDSELAAQPLNVLEVEPLRQPNQARAARVYPRQRAARV